MKRMSIVLSFAAILLAGCRDRYQRSPVKPEDEGVGTLIRYGSANSVIAYEKSSVTFDVKAYTVNEMNHTNFSNEENTDVPKAVSGGLIWREEGLAIGETTVSDGKMTVDGISGFGNALVGIYDEEENLLWSFLIWKPKDDPEDLKQYASIGGCSVMPMALGAMEYGRFNDKGRITNYAETGGLYFQNNRKDPLGRPDLSNTDKKTYVKTYRSDNTVVNWDDDVVSADNILAGMKSDLVYEYSKSRPGLSYREAVQAATDFMAAMDAQFQYPIIDYTIEHPTTLVTAAVGCGYWYAQDSIYRCRHIWNEVKTCYDPCPEGYMLPPCAFYYGFLDKPITTVSGNEDGSESSNSLYSGGPASHTINAKNQENSIADIKGYNFYYYGSLDPTALDYYPAAGYRDNANGKINGFADSDLEGFYASYTTYFSSTYGYIRFMHFNADTLACRYGYPPKSLSVNVRCIKVTNFEDSSSD